MVDFIVIQILLHVPSSPFALELTDVEDCVLVYKELFITISFSTTNHCFKLLCI